MDEAFGQEHETTYGHRAGPEEPVELVNVQVVGQGLPDRPNVPDRVVAEREEASGGGARKAYFGPDMGWLETPILARRELAEGREGPAIVEEYDSTTVIPPGATARLDDYGNIVIAL